jgi:NADPH:quinone reductase
MPSIVIAAHYGGPDALAVIDEPTADPGPGEVRLDVRAVGVNPVDAKRYSGAFGTDPTQLPLRLGAEAAGVVTAVGSGAIGPAGPIVVGDQVIAYPVTGAYAAELIVPASSAVPKPADLDWAGAGGLMVAGVTAVHLLTVTSAGAGDTVLVHGASGGVGLMVVQIAAARGARVIATARPARHEQLLALGAEPVAYGGGAAALAERVRELAGPQGVDVALDLAGTDEALDASLALVADRSRIATILAFGRGSALGIKVLGGAPGADPGTEVRAAARLELVRLVDAGQLQVFVSRTFALADARAAHHAIEDGRGGGKIILLP